MGAINQFKTALLLGILSAILLGIGWSIGGTTGLTIGLGLAIILNFTSYFLSHKIVLKMYKAKEAKETDYPDLYKSVRQVVHLAEIPMPKVYIIPTASANAFATGRNYKTAVVAFTQGILDLLSRDELKGVIAHEIAHIKNKDMLIQTIAATIAAAISYVGFMARWGFHSDDRDSGMNLILLLFLILIPIAAVIIQLALSRTREYLADETGAKMIHNPYALASALEKLHHGVQHRPMRRGNNSYAPVFIVNPFSARGFTRIFSTHPPMEIRVKRLRSMQNL